jgi:hypothetical protein
MAAPPNPINPAFLQALIDSANDRAAAISGGSEIERAARVAALGDFAAVLADPRVIGTNLIPPVTG